jgi:hypothetical protein
VLDVRAAKELKLGGSRAVNLIADVFNLLNDGAMIDVKSQIGTSKNYLLPKSIIRPRILQFGVRVDF